MKLTYGSVCSGIEAATVAWHPLGWKPLWFSQFDPEHKGKGPDFPSAVLAHHYPDVPNLGDMTKLADMILSRSIEAPDILVGGTPCQAFSVAGSRKSLDDERGQLTLAFVRLANAIDEVRIKDGLPAVIVIWENVPGVINTKDNAFGHLLGGLAGEDCQLQPPGQRWENAGCVLGTERAIAWRILDAQYFGLAQRRKRVFVMGSARDDIDCTEILFESSGVRRDIAPSQSKGKGFTRTPASSSNIPEGRLCRPIGYTASSFAQYKEGTGTVRAAGGDLGGGSETIVVSQSTGAGSQVTGTLNKASGDKQFLGNQEAFGGEFHVVSVVHGTQDPCVAKNIAFTLGRNNGQENVVAIAGNIIGRDSKHGGNGIGIDATGICYTLTATDRHGVAVFQQNYVHNIPKFSVRRLTPIECERLQGFPDNYTQIPWAGKPADQCPDGHRYKALGNSMAKNVMHWIGKRIARHLESKYP